MNLATLRMGTLGASRSAVTDDITESAKIYSPDPDPRNLYGTTTAAEYDESPTLRELGLEDMGGAHDAAPSMLSFFNGKPHAEGLKAYNEYLASKR
jgi:hypothetical protein